MMLPGIFAPLPALPVLTPKTQVNKSPVICPWEAFLLPETASGATRQRDLQVFFWWLLSPSLERVPSPSRSGMVRASWGHVAALGPPALLSTPPVESIPHLFLADSPTRQFEFHIGSSGGENKDSSLPQKPSAFPAAQASPPCLGCASASEGGLSPPRCQPAADPGPSGGPGLLPKPAAAWGHQPCSHLLWDSLVSCGIASSKTAAGQVAAA